MTKFPQLDLQFIDEAVSHIAKSPPVRPKAGWARTIREALGMTRGQLGTRIGLTPASVRDLEQNEAKGTVTLESLEKLARGLGGRLVYAIVAPPEKTFEQLVMDQANKAAHTRLSRVLHTMDLEDQAVSERHQISQKKQIVDSLLRGSRRSLWK